MKKIILLFFLFPTFLLAQMKYDNNWMLGHGHSSLSDWKGMRMNFDEGVINFDTVDLGLSLSIYSTTMSNSEGELIFFTNGCSLFDASFSLMENGDTINQGEVHNDYCYEITGSSYPSGQQSIFGIPDLLNDSLYYLFHKSSRIAENPLILTDSFNFTTINIGLNGGLGKVIEKNKVFNVDTFRAQQITAVKHQNTVDWWITTPLYMGNGYKTFLFSSGQITDTLTQFIGPIIDSSSNGSGRSMFSWDGTKYLQYLPNEDLIIFDFDRSTGLFSNPIQIEPDDDIEDGFGSIALSPNGRFIYVNSYEHIHQYDLEAEDIKSSEYFVGEYDGLIDQNPVVFFQGELGLDCKIYISPINSTKYMHVINNPDLPGAACDFVQRGIDLPRFNDGTIPHFPNYRLDTEFPLCTPSPVSTTEDLEPLFPINVYPNPASAQVNIVFGHPLFSEGELILFDNLGRSIYTQSLAVNEREYSIDVSNLARGMYFYSVVIEGEILQTGKVVVER